MEHFPNPLGSAIWDGAHEKNISSEKALSKNKEEKENKSSDGDIFSH